MRDKAALGKFRVVNLRRWPERPLR